MKCFDRHHGHGKRNTIDPYAELNLAGECQRTITKKDAPSPLFLDTKYFDVNEVELDDAPLQLTVWDDVTPKRHRVFSGRAPAPAPAPGGALTEAEAPGRDLVGDADADLAELAKRELKRTWLPLCDERGRPTGKIEIALRWIHNPKKAVAIPKHYVPAARGLDETLEPNEFFVLLVRASRLPQTEAARAKHKASDPYAQCALRGHVRAPERNRLTSFSSGRPASSF